MSKRSIYIAATCAVLALAGCDFILGGELNPAYCNAHPSDPDCSHLPIDAAPDVPPSGCTGDEQCSGGTPVCVIATMTCVQCTAAEPSACTNTTPVCGSDDSCRACQAHGECLSNACLPDGTCGTDSNVAYVDPGGTDNTSCTKLMPCTKVAKALGTSRPYVKFHGTTSEQVSINNQNVTLLADPGSQLTYTANGIVLEVKGTSHVSVADLEITGASGASGYGISMPAGNMASVALIRAKVTNNAAGGISTTGGTLSVQQSTIATNQGGGIAVSGTATFDIRNSFIYRNGDTSASTFGGVNLAVSSAASSHFEFNTVVDNHAGTGITHGGGLICDIVGFTAPNNIVARNSINLSTTDSNSQTLGVCTYPTSRIANDVTGLAFANPDTQPYSYHLTAGSSAIDQATTASTTTVDFDGDMRPQGAADDQGADELK